MPCVEIFAAKFITAKLVVGGYITGIRLADQGAQTGLDKMGQTAMIFGPEVLENPNTTPKV